MVNLSRDFYSQKAPDREAHALEVCAAALTMPTNGIDERSMLAAHRTRTAILARRDVRDSNPLEMADSKLFVVLTRQLPFLGDEESIPEQKQFLKKVATLGFLKSSPLAAHMLAMIEAGDRSEVDLSWLLGKVESEFTNPGDEVAVSLREPDGQNYDAWMNKQKLLESGVNRYGQCLVVVMETSDQGEPVTSVLPAPHFRAALAEA